MRILIIATLALLPLASFAHAAPKKVCLPKDSPFTSAQAELENSATCDCVKWLKAKADYSIKAGDGETDQPVRFVCFDQAGNAPYGRIWNNNQFVALPKLP